MDDLLAQISFANAKRGAVQDENKSYNFQVDSVKHIKPFVSTMSSIGADFNPILPMKPKLLHPTTRLRCDVPERSFTRSQIGPVVKMDFTPKPFSNLKINKSNYSASFLHYLEKHNMERFRHVHEILFRKPSQRRRVASSPFKPSCSSSKSFYDYPLHIFDEESQRINEYL